MQQEQYRMQQEQNCIQQVQITQQNRLLQEQMAQLQRMMQQLFTSLSLDRQNDQRSTSTRPPVLRPHYQEMEILRFRMINQ